MKTVRVLLLAVLMCGVLFQPSVLTRWSHVEANAPAQENLLLFARGTDNALWYCSSVDGVTWSAWTSLGGTFSGDPDAAAMGNGYVAVFVLGPDNNIWEIIRSASGQWSSWIPLPGGGKFSSSPSAAARDSNHLVVFARGMNNALYVKSLLFMNSKVGQWSDWTSLGGVLKTGPDAISHLPGSLIVYVGNTNNGLSCRILADVNTDLFGEANYQWSEWVDMGGSITFDPTAAATDVEHVQVFTINPATKSLMLKEFSGGQWYGPTNFGGQFSSSPDASAWKKGNAEVFARGMDNRIWQMHFGDPGKQGWNPVGDKTFASGPSAVAPYFHLWK